MWFRLDVLPLVALHMNLLEFALTFTKCDCRFYDCFEFLTAV